MMRKKWEIAGLIFLFVVCSLFVLRRDKKYKDNTGRVTIKNAVTVTENGTPIELYELRTFATVCGDHGWISAQGTRASIELSNIVDELKTITWSPDVQISISDEVELYYIDIFDENFEKLARYFHTMEGFEDFWAEADAGVYYVAIAVNWNGKYILKEKEYERYGAEFVFGLVKE